MNFNQMGRSLFIVLMAVLFASQVFPAAAGNTVSQKFYNFKDANGMRTKVRLPVKRVVVLTSDALEVVRSLGATDCVAGVYSGISKNSLFWPQLNDKPKVGTWKEINYEQVARLNPDAVLCYGARPGRQMEKKLAPFKIQVIRLDFYKPATLQREVEILGRILGKQKAATELAAWYGKHLTRIKTFFERDLPHPKVYIEGNSNYHTAAPGSGGHDMCMAAGGDNIARTLAIPYPEVTPEWIVTANPDVVVKVTTNGVGGSCYSKADVKKFKFIRDGIIKRSAWEHINAVKQGRIYVIANDIWTGPRAVIGMYYLVKWFFPDRSTDFHPDRLHRQYLEKFQTIPYQGVYVYPELEDAH